MTTNRRGAPRPLAAHLAAALLRPAEGPDAPTDAALRARMRPFLNGIAAYQEASTPRRGRAAREVARFGSARLLAFETPDLEPGAPALLAAPSLINRAAILDLTPKRSLMRGLAARGVRSYLLDWGPPKGEERGFTLADYVERRLRPALATAAAEAGRPVALLGHCLSGGLAAAAAQRAPEHVAGLALMAAPWRYAALAPDPAPSAATLGGLIDACGVVFGGVPADIWRWLFYVRDPLQGVRKFEHMTRSRSRKPNGRLFVAIEDWLNDGHPVAAPAARELALDWILTDALAAGGWRIAGESIDLKRVERPILIIASRRDGLTPYDSALAARTAAPHAALLEPAGGHVSMIVGARAPAALWDPVARWARRPADGVDARAEPRPAQTGAPSARRAGAAQPA